ncbi:hypothetical protein B0T24DRAFT_272087 [Lasiosphaeria ovina]|uniref:Uncharacterized protein n=1 Tax=Lasiosphaeria ovina TaxID=92902 RepID=A0AAE0N8T9_9PEZI|nr:hypothetical protein B0T24DRAFT_272087 [Lasiosphaeria ovina]
MASKFVGQKGKSRRKTEVDRLGEHVLQSGAAGEKAMEIRNQGTSQARKLCWLGQTKMAFHWIAQMRLRAFKLRWAWTRAAGSGQRAASSKQWAVGERGRGRGRGGHWEANWAASEQAQQASKLCSFFPAPRRRGAWVPCGRWKASEHACGTLILSSFVQPAVMLFGLPAGATQVRQPELPRCFLLNRPKNCIHLHVSYSTFLPPVPGAYTELGRQEYARSVFHR